MTAASDIRPSASQPAPSQAVARDTTGEVLIIGAGPAGLTAAVEFVRAGRKVTVVESDPHYVGGIARTVQYKEFRLDIGGHRFYSKIEEIENWWKEILPDDFIEVPRKSRIYYRRKFLDYPLRAMDAYHKLGFWFSFTAVLWHLYRKVLPLRPEVSFRDWVTNRFGDKLFHTFFESYTEKVWGIKCTEISADWAAQRIQGLSIPRILLRAIAPNGFGGRSGASLKTLIDKFHYPRLGCGMVWEKAREIVQQAGNRVDMDRTVTAIHMREGRVVGIRCRDRAGSNHEYPCSSLVSSMPLRELVEVMDPPAPAEVREAAAKLRYRDFITVGLLVKRENCFPDNWIYIHDPEVKLGRIQNFRNWSPEMVPKSGVSFLGLEYFCFEGDGLWTSKDEDLIELGRREIDKIGLVRADEVMEGTVVRMPKAYPIYDDIYRGALDVIRKWLATIPNLRSAGRNAMHQYNNQDHSMMTALISARNLLGTDQRDAWMVNHNAEYIEERITPKRLKSGAESPS